MRRVTWFNYFARWYGCSISKASPLRWKQWRVLRNCEELRFQSVYLQINNHGFTYDPVWNRLHSCRFLPQNKNVVGKFDVSDPTIVADLYSSKVVKGTTHYPVCGIIEQNRWQRATQARRGKSQESVPKSRTVAATSSQYRVRSLFGERVASRLW